MSASSKFSVNERQQPASSHRIASPTDTHMPASYFSSMEDRCIPLQALTLQSTNWFVKVFVAEKTPIRKTNSGARQRLVFIDNQNTRMQCIIYKEDVEQLDKVLLLYRTYYVGNGKVKELPPLSPVLAPSEYHIVLSKSSSIRATPREQELPLNHIYQTSPFAACPQFGVDSDQRINLLCAVIHVFPVRRVQRKDKLLQEFVILNQECRPMILTLWDDFLQHEAQCLVDSVHKMPVILGMRLSVNTFHGKSCSLLLLSLYVSQHSYCIPHPTITASISLGTAANTTILFDPPLPEANQLQSWLKSNKEYVELVISDKLYDKQEQIPAEPLECQFRKISQITSLTQMIKSFWIKGSLRVAKPVQSFYHMTCPTCSKICGAAYGYESLCLHCNTDFPKAKAILRFEVEVFDGSGSLNATIEDRETEAMLGMSAETIAQKDMKGTKITADFINAKFQNVRQLMHIRTSSFDARGKTYTHYTIEACLPTSSASASSSASLPSEDKSSSSPTQKAVLPDISMTESEDTTSSMQKESDPTDLSFNVPTSAVKRGLDLPVDPQRNKPKHAKED